MLLSKQLFQIPSAERGKGCSSMHEGIGSCQMKVSVKEKPPAKEDPRSKKIRPAFVPCGGAPKPHRPRPCFAGAFTIAHTFALVQKNGADANILHERKKERKNKMIPSLPRALL